jgi:hypothetical protein
MVAQMHWTMAAKRRASVSSLCVDIAWIGISAAAIVGEVVLGLGQFTPGDAYITLLTSSRR